MHYTPLKRGDQRSNRGPFPLEATLVTLLLSHQAAVRSMMDQIVEETVPPPSLLSEMCQHHLAAGGKGFRSSLCLSLCEALGADPEDCLPAAVCLELVHRTSLVFDDIQDRTPERNGQPALWEKYGMEQSLNAGLALSGCARMALTKLTGPSLPEGVALRTLQIMETSLVRLCWGQCLDLQQQNGGPPNLLEYLQMVRLKTGALLAEEVYPLLSCRSGKSTAQLQQLVLRDLVHAVTRAVVEEGRRETLTVLKELEERVPMPRRRSGGWRSW